MNRKHNQYRNKATRAAGSTAMDTDEKNKVRAILTELNFTQIQTDPYMVIDVMHNTYRFHDVITREMFSKMSNYKIRHPDILAFRDGKPYIFEIDGAVHRDWDNDYDYDTVEIDYVKINVEYLKQIGMDWQTWIELELKR